MSTFSSGQSPPPKKPWHSFGPVTTLQALDSSSAQGLSQEEAEQRLSHYGRNEIVSHGGRSHWGILLDQFKDIMLLLLIAVAVISGVLDFLDLQQAATSDTLPFKDTVAILLIVTLNGLLGYFQESKAEQALAALKQMASPQVEVIRDGQRRHIDSSQLVPGDIFLLAAGDQLCADGQLLEAANLQIRESALTGEAHGINKSCVARGVTPDTPLGDRNNMVFTGTEVLRGRGKAVVTSTGMGTELGKIAQMLQTVEHEPTPLQKRMDQLAAALVTGSLIIVALTIIVGTLQVGNFSRFRELLEVSLSMAVAVVPEGLPAVITVTLAIGTQRMVQRQALIRKLPAVETLGSVNVICSDKTGTLTQNKMVVQAVATPRGYWQVSGQGYEPVGEFYKSEGEAITFADNGELHLLLLNCILCNDAVLVDSQVSETGTWGIGGDPTEGALLTLAGKAKFDIQGLRRRFPRLGELSFSAERKRMSTLNQILPSGPNLPASLGVCLGENGGVILVKGSPESLLDCCDRYHQGQEVMDLTQTVRQTITTANLHMAQQGLRVLGFAYKFDNDTFNNQILGANHQQIDLTPEAESELIWLGLAGMMDATRPEAQQAVQRCQAAGIRPVMITGDHPKTAAVIAQQLNIAPAKATVLTGEQVAQLSPAELESQVEQISVYARVAPEHKLSIVKALQRRHHFVAMTGDGVNDAPALKQANIGIAMGIAGTDVSKEASDLVLLDDNFATIVAAAEQGRVVYSNIRRFIKYILGSNIGEVLTIAAAPLLGLGTVPLTPLQILWMNLVTDGLPALALAVEPAAPEVMQGRPFNPKDSIFAQGLGSYMIRVGLIFSLITIALMVWAYQSPQGSNGSWKTMVFTTLCLAQMGHAIAARSDRYLTCEMNPLGNVALLAAVSVTSLLQLLLIYVKPLQIFFGTQPLTAQQLLICIGCSSLVFVWVELEKLVIRTVRPAATVSS